MKLESKFFGPVEYEAQELIHLTQALPGFEEEREFLLLPFAGSERQMLCFQSVKTPALAFVLLDPFTLDPTYAPAPKAEELQELGVEKKEELFFYVLCAVRTPVGDSTVNLRCPLAINPHSLQARQVILEEESYEMRCPLSSFAKEMG